MPSSSTEVSQIDLLVHMAFLHQSHTAISERSFHTPEYLDFLVRLYKQRIDQIARDPKRVMIFMPSITADIGFFSPQRWNQHLRDIAGQEEPGKAVHELMQYAKQKLGKRLIVIVSGIQDAAERGTSVSKLMKARGLQIDPFKIKVEAYGEYAHGCVKGELEDFCRELKINLHDPNKANVKLDLCGDKPELVLATQVRKKLLARFKSKPRIRRKLRNKIQRKGILKRHKQSLLR
ncbi:MAG: hypothetical protein Q7S92_06775 [Candidatus Diapherotrites archaeon]|nr:hypothetical protein [Candidatus Diapherotrites archaeon]